MQTRYFAAAWQDIKNSPGWVGKLLILSLLMFIPVFGHIVLLGYLLGWARDMAWGVHAPLPQRIFGNEDGKLYSRGFFAWVISVVFGIVLLLGTFTVSSIAGVVLFGAVTCLHDGVGAAMAAGAFTVLLGLFSFVLPLAAVLAGMLFQWVGWMRMSVYSRLSAGFQLGKIWAMIRHDSNGIARILGMSLLILIVGGFAVSIVALAAFLIVLVAIAFAVGMGAAFDAPSSAVWAVLLAFAASLVFGYAAMVLAVFSQMMTMRALGYWTYGFEVPLWQGQDDPMPFQIRGAAPPGGGA